MGVDEVIIKRLREANQCFLAKKNRARPVEVWKYVVGKTLLMYAGVVTFPEEKTDGNTNRFVEKRVN